MGLGHPSGRRLHRRFTPQCRASYSRRQPTLLQKGLMRDTWFASGACLFRRPAPLECLLLRVEELGHGVFFRIVT
jgi:hypothetical protein